MKLKLYTKPNSDECYKTKRFIMDNGLSDILHDDLENWTAIKSFGLTDFPALEIQGYGAIGDREDIIKKLIEIYKIQS